MRLTTSLLLLALMSAIAFCYVQETARQTRLRFQLAEALRQEDSLRRQLEDVRAWESQLLQTPRLMEMNLDPSLRYVPLRSWAGTP
jgi:hypothetical protein